MLTSLAPRLVQAIKCPVMRALPAVQPHVRRVARGVAATWLRPLSTTAAMCAEAGPASSMRAVLLDEPSSCKCAADVLHVRDVDMPEPAPGQVRVKVHATGVCHRDVLDRKGAFPFINRPTILGHEIAGVIDAVGDGVDPSQVGTRVVSLHWAPCGHCAACQRGESTVCANARGSFFALTTNGGYADYVVNGASAFVPVPRGWSAVDAATVQCTHGTVWHAAVVKGRLRPGESVLVTGASGGVGSAAVQLFSAMGARVVAVTSNPDKTEYLEALGATDVVVRTADDPHVQKSAAVKALGGVDMAFESVGEPTFGTALRCLRPGGRLVLTGNVTNSSAALPLGLMIINSLEVIGSDSITAAELTQVFDFMTTNNIRPNISQVLALEEVATAHDMLEKQGVTGRLVLSVGGPW